MTVHFGQNLDFFTITTEVDITDPDTLAIVNQIIGLRAQPVLAGVPYQSGDDFVYRFAAIDKAWDAVPSLLETLIEHAGTYGFSEANTNVTKAERL